jgi:DNA-binding MarR family transcriptional regulator
MPDKLTSKKLAALKRRISADERLGNEARKVAGYFVARGFGWKAIRQASIARTLGMHQPNVSRAIKLLISTELLRRRRRSEDDRRCAYRLVTSKDVQKNAANSNAVER